MLKFLPLILLPSLCFAQNFKPVSTDYRYQDAPEYQAILGQLKLQGDFSDKSKPGPVVPVDKKMSRGEQVVAEAKARNKAFIAAQTEAEKAKAAGE